MSDYSAVGPPQQNYNQSTAFAAALIRAKQIAAKINPGTATTPEPRPKRPLEEGQEPDAKKAPPNLGPPPQQQLSPIGGPPPISNRPPSHQNNNMGGPAPCLGSTIHEDITVPDKMVGLIIGRGGEQITRLQSESGCNIQMAPDSQGMNERVCSLSGTKDAINRAKELILNIVHQRGRTEGLEPNDGPPMGGHNNYSGMNQGMGSGGHGPPGGHGNPNHGPPGGGPMGMGGGQGGGGGRHVVEIMIPGPKVGLIIGKGGETIKQLQEKSGAKMVVIQEGPNQEQEKPLRITGDTQKVEYAKQLVYELIAEKEIQSFNRRGGGGRGGPPSDDRQQGGFNDYGGGPGGQGGNGAEVLVPRAAVGVVIGKGGDMIKKIQAETGARVQFQQAREEGPGERTCFLQGNPKQVEQARQRIEELIDSVQRRDEGGGPQQGMRGGSGRGGGRFDNRNNRNGNGDYGGGWNDRQAQQEVSFIVPSLKCGVIIGRGGETIKQINQQSGAHCELDRRAQNPNPNDKTFVIRGDPDQIEAAKRIIQDKVQIRLNFTVTSGGGGGNGGGGPPPMANNIPTAYPGMTPQGYNPQGWGMSAAYPQQQQQPQQQQWGAPSAPPPDQTSQAAQNMSMNMNAAGGPTDYTIQWAEYYRSMGFNREADAIEQSAKNKGVASATGMTTPVAVATGVPAATTPAVASAANGQQDFSVQWAEYYRKWGRIQDAEAIEEHLKKKQGSQPVVPTQGAVPAAAPQAPAGTYQPQPYGAYAQPASAGYYGAQPQSAVPGGVPQTAGYNYPSYGYGAPAPGAPSSQEN